MNVFCGIIKNVLGLFLIIKIYCNFVIKSVCKLMVNIYKSIIYFYFYLYLNVIYFINGENSDVEGWNEKNEEYVYWNVNCLII